MTDAEFVTGLMRDNYEAVGFIPAPTVAEQYMRHGRYVMQTTLTGRPVGYLLHGKPKAGGALTIAQHCIDVDFRLRGFGQDAVRVLVARAQAANCRAIHLRCADGLTANEFWLAQGFELTSVIRPNNRRQRAINYMVLDLWPTLFKP